MARNRVVVGPNVPFDLTITGQEGARHGQPWQDRIFIGPLSLTTLLDPMLRKYELEALTEIDPFDRHRRPTALGHARVTAELSLRVTPAPAAGLRDPR